MTGNTARRFTFLAKAGGATALIALATVFFYGEEPGGTLGYFALAWAAILALVRPDVRRHRAASLAVVAAAAFGGVLVDDPGPLAWCLFWVAIASATLLPLHRFDDAMTWGARLLLHGLSGLGTPVRDLRRLRAHRGPARTSTGAIAAALVLPIGGGGVFLALFASANPLVGRAFAAIRFPDLSSAVFHIVFWIVLLLAVWPSFRPRNAIVRIAAGAPGTVGMGPEVPLATLTLSLVTFNAIFAIQNALDLAFLWSGAPLPAGVTLADYAHRGAYPLIATALLAAGFVLFAARPGSVGAGSLTVRRLIVIWVAQNLLLVASSILRTLDYIAAYSLTELRIAALAWMTLVAVGLFLIVWRMLAGRSARWLINANALAAGIVLAAASATDLDAIAAHWNVRHARHADDLDLCYLQRLGPSALLPLIELERRAGGPVLRDTAASLRLGITTRLAADQTDWHSWTWRGARRLSRAEALLGPRPYQPATPRRCNGSIIAPAGN